MDVKDFLPKYPNIDQSKYDILNPYEEDFYEAIFHKKEFYDNKLERVEIFPRERGMLTKYQKTIVRYISNYTPYDRLLLVHFMGSGKTCSAIGAIEHIKQESNSFNGALILAKGSKLLKNFLKSLVETCTAGQYIPEKYEKLTELEKKHRINKKTSFYQFRTFATFAKDIKNMSDVDIVDNFSNKIIVVDEVHNLRIQAGQNDEEALETYEQFHRFFHLVKNCKVLFLSGTPMKDGPEEIASVGNLMLPLDKQFPTGEDFLNEYMTKEGENLYSLIPEKGMELKQKLKGYISFLREAESSVPKEFIGRENFGGLNHFIVSPNTMSEFQTRGYKLAYNEDKGGQSGVWTNSRGASLFVYPDGSYGRKGFNKFILKTREGKYKLNEELKNAIKGKTDEETLQNLSKYSGSYADVIGHILNTNGNCFVYSSSVKGSGAILFALILELFNFKSATGREDKPGLRYALLADEIVSEVSIERITAKFNSRQNIHGEYIKVIIGTRAISEGFSFKNVVFEAILTPHWNYSEIAQALARGIRLGSHNELLKENPNVKVKIIQVVSVPAKGSGLISIDLHNWKTAEDKDRSIHAILRLLMETAFDCALNYFRNRIEGEDGSRECDYTTCKYTCDGIDMAEVENGIDEKDLDYSTYQLYYANPKTPLILKKIEQLFRMTKQTNRESIVKNLQGQFTEEEINNALFLIQEESESDEFDYRTFLNLYSRTPVKKIMNEIEEMFRGQFQLTLDNIVKHFPQYTEFEIVSALQTIINDSITITNKYGLSCYLKEQNNTYFLVNSLSVRPDFYTEYYARFPHVVKKRTFEEIMVRIYSMTLPKLIKQLCKFDGNKEEFNLMMKNLPLAVQEIFIEASLSAEDKKIEHNVELRQHILAYFQSYVKQVNNTWVSTLLKDNDEVLRCNEVGADYEDWKDCENRYNQLLAEQEEKRLEQLKADNPYGIMGKYNPEKGSFCIIDFEKEKEILVSKKKTDKRLNYSGKVCGAGGWKLPELLTIVIKRLKIDPPDTFRGGDTETMREKARAEEKIREIFTEEEIDSADKKTLKRMIYWGLTKKDGGIRGIKTICTGLKQWFEEKGLLEIDNQCGVQGKKKIAGVKKEKTKVFRVETIIPNKDTERFGAYVKDIGKMMSECFDVKRYKAVIDDTMWILVFARKKIVGFLTIDKDNIIWNVCVAKNYRRQGIATDAMKQATEYVCDIKGKSPTLMVDNKNKDAKKLIRMYTSFGFEIVRSDDKYTYMKHSCGK